jgi:hypothetical protein
MTRWTFAIWSLTSWSSGARAALRSPGWRRPWSRLEVTAQRWVRLLDRLEQAPRSDDWPYEEPSAWGEILALLPEPAPTLLRLDAARLRDRLAGAWLGRCAGCMLGKPVEGWTHAQLRGYLELA